MQQRNTAVSLKNITITCFEESREMKDTIADHNLTVLYVLNTSLSSRGFGKG